MISRTESQLTTVWMLDLTGVTACGGITAHIENGPIWNTAASKLDVATYCRLFCSAYTMAGTDIFRVYTHAVHHYRLM